MLDLCKKLIVFRFSEDSLMFRLASALERREEGELLQLIKEVLNEATRYGWDGNLWHCVLTHEILTNENSYTLSKERRSEQLTGSIQAFLLHDMAILQALFAYEFASVDQALSLPCFAIITDYHAITKRKEMYDGMMGECIVQTAKRISQLDSPQELLQELDQLYCQYGVGMIGYHKAFRIREDQVLGCTLSAITSLDTVTLDDLIGYESQKQELRRNTESFLQGKKANNVLLYGESGTGKSTSIKALANMYYAQGLRLIEIHKHQFSLLHEVMQRIKTRNYHFIIYMDDLSFEEDETEYKYLKAVIEGGLETRPGNILIYATSNRRHLIKETWRDRNDVVEEQDLHLSETMSEKLSLAARFGINIYYGKPSPKEYQSIVRELAQKEHISHLKEEELWQIANAWELRHGGMSGRCARQLIDYLSAKDNRHEHHQ